MFWNRNYSVFSDAAKLRQENASLILKNDALALKVDALQTELENLQKRIREEASTASMLLDFNNIDVFSIERNVKEDVAITIIGHWLLDKDGVKSSAEWVLYCNAETHEKLVADFNKKLQTK